MKWKLLTGGLLVVACVGFLAIKGISQVPSPQPDSFSPLSPPPLPGSTSSPPRNKTFEQLAEDLKPVRAKQKELKAQEEDILKKMAASVEEKRKDLEKAEGVLRQLQGKPHEPDRFVPDRPAPPPNKR